MIDYSRAKGELEETVLSLGYDSVTVFRPSLLLEERQEFRMGEQIAQLLGKCFLFVIPERYKPSRAETVARAIIRYACKGTSGVRIVESCEMPRDAKECILH